MSKNIYGSDVGVIDAGIIYDRTEAETQDVINAALRDEIEDTYVDDAAHSKTYKLTRSIVDGHLVHTYTEVTA